MKKIIAAILLIAGFTANAQDKEKIFSSTELVWFGLDFTKATFVGQFDQGMGAMPANGTDMKNKWIPGWNSLVVAEPQNFDFRKNLNKESVYLDINSVNELNSKIDPNKCMDINPGKLEAKEIDAMVKKYNSKTKKEGVGFSFIVENFDKGTQMASVYVTFFDIPTKKVLLVNKVEGKAVGIGMRNYWAGAIKAIIKKTGAEYKNW